jgi:predicted ATPase/DNA-binding XRE family transcriptional regulator/Tfp pilus assembly protein PilF
MDVEHEFGAWMRRLRAERDLTQDALAEAVGCANQTIRAIESGRRRPSREMAERIAQMLEVPASEHERFIRLARAPRSEASVSEDASPMPVEQPPISASTGRLPRFRPPHNPLIGRVAELQELAQLLRDDRQALVTLVGPGGIGKTRLAQQAMIELAPAFADGAAFLGLAGVSEASTLAAMLAEQLGCMLSKEQPADEALVACLGEREMLLVLDNLEQLLVPEQSAQLSRLLGMLLRDAPEISLLITSRERLRLRSERVIELGGLSLPTSSSESEMQRSEAYLLFLDCARRLVHQYAPTAEDRAAIVRICQLLEGTPLAIELAASWLPVLAPDEIAQEIERDLDFLALANRDAEPHHHSLRAVFQRSWALLSKEEQYVLPRLAVLRGNFTREAAEFVARASLNNLATLMQKSLLRRTSSTHYDLHEVVRHYSLSYLPAPERSQVTQRHLDYYLALSGQAGVGFNIGQPQPWVEQLLPELDNLRAALNAGLQPGNLDKGAQLCAALRDFWRLQHFVREGIRWNERYLARPMLTRLVRGRLLLSLSLLTYLSADTQRSLHTAREAVELLQQVGAPAELADALENLATAETVIDDYVNAKIHLEAALALYQQHGTHTNVARVYNDLGNLSYAQNQFKEAEHWYSEALALARANGDLYSTGIAMANMGAMRILNRDPGGGVPLQKALLILHDQQYHIGVAFVLELLAAYQGLRGAHERAVRVLSAANSLRLAIQSPVTPENEAPLAQAAALARGPLDEATFQQCWAEGTALPLETVIELAREE